MPYLQPCTVPVTKQPVSSTSLAKKNRLVRCRAIKLPAELAGHRDNKAKHFIYLKSAVGP